MTRKRKAISAKERLNRYFMITKVFLAITPLICYFYVSLKASMLGLTFQQLLTQDPSTTVIFLIAMLNPYIAYLVQIIQKKLENKDYHYACINMGLLLVAQVLTMNAFYFMMLAYVFYCAKKYYNLEILSTIKEVTMKQSFLFGGGSMIVIGMSAISLFASLRLM